MNQNLKIYYILPAVILVIIIVIVLLLPKSNAPTPQTPTPTGNQLPTRIPANGNQSSSSPQTGPSGSKSDITPTLIPSAFTGAIEDQHIPQAETDLAVQKNELRKKTPLTEPSFTVTFDYAEDLFVVTLNEPKDTSRSIFNQWLQANYPNIPLDRFSIK